MYGAKVFAHWTRVDLTPESRLPFTQQIIL